MFKPNEFFIFLEGFSMSQLKAYNHLFIGILERGEWLVELILGFGFIQDEQMSKELKITITFSS